MPLLGIGLVDSLKLGLISCMGFLTLPSLLAGGESYAKATKAVNNAAPKGFTIRTSFGLFYCRNYDDLLVLWPPYEAELTKFFTCGADSVFIDVGSHVGRYTVMLSRRLMRVVSIEPDFENFTMLQRNIGLNNLRNIDVLNVACWDEPRLSRKLYLAPSPGKHSLQNPQSRFEQVTTSTLDQVTTELHILPSEVGLIKIDAEGAELEILKGGEQLLTLGRPRVIFEAFPERREAAEDLLRSYGYGQIARVGEINFVADK